MLRIAILTAEIREHKKDYANPTPGFGTPIEALLPAFAALPDVEVHFISCLRQPVNAPKKLADNIWYHALHVPKIGWMRTAYQGCIRATRKKLREIRPDIVHGQGTEHNNALCAVFSGFPNVLTIHGNMRIIAKLNHARPFSFEWLAARLETFTIPRSDGVVCITNYTREAVAGLAKKTWVVPNAVDPGFFEVQSELPREIPVILCVGNICQRKNQNNFIRALDSLAQRKRFKIIFLGAAPEHDDYVREFSQLVAARAWCEFGGFASREKLKGFLRDAAFLTLPTLEDNCPMVVLEAMAAGVPVIAARVGGVPDLIEDGKTGLLCDSQSAASMSGAVEKLLDQPELGRTLAVEARRSADKRFHPEVIARRHLEIYREVLGNGGLQSG
jgi:glycosyltransferase involved in cell wall biosynthesis